MGMELQIRAFLKSALYKDELSGSRPGCFTFGKEAAGTHGIFFSVVYSVFFIVL
jgi:hypothetical protein